MTIKELNKSKKPIVKIDNSLEKFNYKVLFPEKLEKANEVLGKAGVPVSKKTFGRLNGKKKAGIPKEESV
ncbi:MAG: hypothetical protein ACRD6X_05025 [Pyrinomonadaceae bacterium]